MKIKVKLIGRYKDIVGKSEFKLEIKNGDTIWHVVDLLAQKHPQIEKDKKFIMVSKNNVFTNYEANIKEGDEIAISPPVVSG